MNADNCRETEKIWNGQSSRKLPPGIQDTARRKLRILNDAGFTDTSGESLEALRGDRVGQYSIRINDQYRICFVWRQGEANQVEIVDYH